MLHFFLCFFEGNKLKTLSEISKISFKKGIGKRGLAKDIIGYKSVITCCEQTFHPPPPYKGKSGLMYIEFCSLIYFCYYRCTGIWMSVVSFTTLEISVLHITTQPSRNVGSFTSPHNRNIYHTRSLGTNQKYTVMMRL